MNMTINEYRDQRFIFSNEQKNRLVFSFTKNEVQHNQWLPSLVDDDLILISCLCMYANEWMKEMDCVDTQIYRWMQVYVGVQQKPKDIL